jgi:hypothetical protein
MDLVVWCSLFVSRSEVALSPCREDAFSLLHTQDTSRARGERALACSGVRSCPAGTRLGFATLA